MKKYIILLSLTVFCSVNAMQNVIKRFKNDNGCGFIVYYPQEQAMYTEFYEDTRTTFLTKHLNTGLTFISAENVSLLKERHQAYADSTTVQKLNKEMDLFQNQLFRL